MSRCLRSILLWLVLGLLLTPGLPRGPSAGSLSLSARTAPWPTIEWAISSPQRQDLDPSGLEEAFSYGEAHRSKAMVVIRRGFLVKEWYDYGWDKNSTKSGYSVAKSFTSALIGMLIDEGRIQGLDQPVSDFVPQWRDAAQGGITIRHLLTMTSGLSCTPISDYLELLSASNQSLFAIRLPMEAQPGQTWEYSNSAVQVLAEVILRASGRQAKDYARERLWPIIGMWNADWTADAVGNTLTYQAVVASAREFAKFGYLFLRRGLWVSRRVVSASWVDESVRPSQSLNPHYGFLWWTNSGGDWWPAVPADAYAAMGAFNQRIYVVPSLDLVVVRIGEEDLQWSDNAFLGPICQSVLR